MLETCLVLRRGLGNPVDIAATLSTLSQAQIHAGNAAAAECAEREALQIFLQIGDRMGEAIGQLHLGQIALHIGNDALAASHLEECLSLARELKNQEFEGECELGFGAIGFEAGNASAARLHFDRALTVCREAGDKRGEASALWWLGKADLQVGDLVSARSQLANAMRTFRGFEMRDELVSCIEDCSILARAEGQAVVGVRLASAVEMARERLGFSQSLRSQERWQSHIKSLRDALAPAEFEAAWREGRAWGVDGVVRSAMADGRQFDCPTP
jgi:tetratricopeptide (TPR) repeat protein